MNKRGERINRTQLKENEWCLRNFQNERLATATFDDCTTADDRGRVQRAADRTADREAKKCDPLAMPPAFGYTSATVVNTAGVSGALSLLYTLFGGPPVSDADLFTKADNRDTAKCQFELLKRTDKLESTVLKEINKAKRQALRDEAVDSQAALEAKLLVVLSSNNRISRTQDQLVSGVDRKCASLLAPPGTIFPGTCGAGNPSLSEVEDCAIAAARCEACLKINAFDALNLDCDQADDQDNGNGSCS